MAETFDRLTPEQAVERLKAINDGPEEGHIEADDILLMLLNHLGHAEVVREFLAAKHRNGFWYA